MLENGDENGDAAAETKSDPPFILRRLKQDVLKGASGKAGAGSSYAQMEGEQRAAVSGTCAAAAGESGDTESDEGSTFKGKIQILAQLTRLRQICCNPATFV